MKGWSPFKTHEKGHTIKVVNTPEEMEKIDKDYDDQMAIQFPPDTRTDKEKRADQMKEIIKQKDK